MKIKNLKIKKLATAMGTGIAYLMITSPVLAAFNDVNIGKPDEVKITEISPLIQGIIRIIFVVAVILTFMFLLWGGIQWIVSGGDKSKYEEARNRITAAIIGLAIIALAWLLIKIVTYFFGLPDLFGGDTFRASAPRFGSSTAGRTY